MFVVPGLLKMNCWRRYRCSVEWHDTHGGEVTRFAVFGLGGSTERPYRLMQGFVRSRCGRGTGNSTISKDGE